MCGICYEDLEYDGNCCLNNRHFTCIQCLNHMCESCIVNMGMYLDVVTCPYCRKQDFRECLGYYSSLSEPVLNEIRKKKRFISNGKT